MDMRRNVGFLPVWAWVGLVALVVVVAVAVSTAGSDRPGDTAVYDRIGRAPTCSAALAEFDAAKRNADAVGPAYSDASRIAASYMTAALHRMDELGCDQPDGATRERVRENR